MRHVSIRDFKKSKKSDFLNSNAGFCSRLYGKPKLLTLRSSRKKLKYCGNYLISLGEVNVENFITSMTPWPFKTSATGKLAFV